MLENKSIYKIEIKDKEKINIKKILLMIIIIILLIVLLLIINTINERIKTYNVYQKYKAQIIKIQKEKEQEIAKIEAEKERKRQEKIPKLTEKGKENIKNIYKSDTKRVFLTFDDGPSTNTTNILDILKKENVKATFFVLGSRVKALPEITKKMYEEGHFIANHGYSHEYTLIYSSSQAVLEEYKQCNEVVKNAIGVPEYNSHLFRYPGGYTGGPYVEIKTQAEQLLNENDIVHIDWNALSGDAETSKPTVEFLLKRTQETVANKNSVVILMHDAQAKKATVEALPQIINYLRQNGYEFKNFYEIIK